MKKLFILLLGCLFFAGCAAKDPSAPATSETPQPNQENTLSIEDYFPLENKTYSFKGDGNEYAAYKETFFSKEGNYLPAITENGGTRIFKVYELTADGIYVVYEEAEYYEETLPPIEAVKSQFNRTPLLLSPLIIGKTFDGWEMVKIDEEMSLPFGELNDVIVLERKDEENQSVVRTYWAPEYGKVKQDFVSGEGEQEFVVVSELEKVE